MKHCESAKVEKSPKVLQIGCVPRSPMLELSMLLQL